MKNSKLFEIFALMPVQIVTKSIKSRQHLGEDQFVEGSVVLEGILIDECDDYFYLGIDETAVDQAIRKEEVVRISVPTPEDLLSSFDTDDEGTSH